MASLERSLTVRKPIEVVADYLSDLVTSVEWDPHTVDCRQLDDGAVAVGTRYEHIRAFSGYRVSIQVDVVDYEPRSRIVWLGRHQFADGRETFEFRREPDGATTVSHAVDIKLRGIARLMGERFLPSVIQRIADSGTATLRERLERLP